MKPKQLRVLPEVQNFAKFIMTHPCADPFPILVETFFPAALQFAMMIYIPQWEDIAMLRFQEYPRYGKGRSPLRAGSHASRKEKKGKPISRALAPNQGFTANKYVAGLTTFLHYFVGPIETIGLWWTVFEATDKFAYTWQTLLEQREYCSGNPNSGPLQLYNPSGTQLFTSTGAVSALPVTLQNRAGWGHTPFDAGLPVGQYYGWFSISVKAVNNAIPNAWVQIDVVSIPGINRTFKGANTTISAEVWTDLIVTFYFDAPLAVTNAINWSCWQGQTGTGPCDMRDARFFVAGGKPQ